MRVLRGLVRYVGSSWMNFPGGSVLAVRREQWVWMTAGNDQDVPAWALY